MSASGRPRDAAMDSRRRSAAELRQLVDSGQLALLIAFLVALGLPWWTQTDATFEKAGTYTGWGSLGAGSGEAGLAWIAVIGMILVLAAAPFRRRWASISAAVLGALAAVGTVMAVVGTPQNFGQARRHLDRLPAATARCRSRPRCGSAE